MKMTKGMTKFVLIYVHKKYLMNTTVPESKKHGSPIRRRVSFTIKGNTVVTLTSPDILLSLFKTTNESDLFEIKIPHTHIFYIYLYFTIATLKRSKLFF